MQKLFKKKNLLIFFFHSVNMHFGINFDLHMPRHVKDILIGLLVAYVVMDLLLAYVAKARHPGLFATLQNAMKDENTAMIVVIGLAAGALAYILARRSKDYFSTKKEETQ